MIVGRTRTISFSQRNRPVLASYEAPWAEVLHGGAEKRRDSHLAKDVTVFAKIARSLIIIAVTAFIMRMWLSIEKQQEQRRWRVARPASSQKGAIKSHSTTLSRTYSVDDEGP